MITIGQLAAYADVTIKTVRYYHQLLKIKTLTDAACRSPASKNCSPPTPIGSLR